ncbi:MAG: DsbA family protein [Chroococcales cyanobacterium]
MRSLLKLSKKLLTIIALLLCLTWAFPVQAATKNEAKLEEQVLEIIRKNPEVIIETLQNYQQQQQSSLQQIRELFVQALKSNPKFIIGDSPTQGATDLNIVLLEFSDYQCPFCAKAHETLKTFMAKHGDEVTLAYKHFPLNSIHPQAFPAAQAAYAAQQQGKFWEYHDQLFQNQDKLSEDFYVKLAKNLNLDIEKFNQDRESASSNLEKDIEMASRLGLSGTPFFIMNDQAFSGAIELTELEQILARIKEGNR